MRQIKRAISLVLSLAIILGIAVIPGNAQSGFSVSFVATSDAAGNTPVSSVKAGDVVYIQVMYEGNTKANNICAFDLTVQYDSSLFTTAKTNDFVGIDAVGATGNAQYATGEAFVNWANADGLYDIDNDVVRTSGRLARLKCAAIADIDNIEAGVFAVDSERSFFANAEETKLPYESDSLVLPVTISSSIGIYTTEDSTVDAPYVGQEAATITYHAIVTDETGAIEEKPVVSWEVSGASGAVTVTDGVVSVPSTAVEGNYTVKATYGTGDTARSAEKSFAVEKEDPVAQSMEISYEPTALTVPADEKGAVTATPTVTATDQYGDVMVAPNVTYALEGTTYDGVSLNEETGVLTVTNAAKDAFTTEGTELTITATCGQATDTATVKVSKAQSVATSITILQREPGTTTNTNATPIGDSITIEKPEIYNSSRTLFLGAVVKDQYGEEIKDATVIWSTDPPVPMYSSDSNYQGVTANEAGNNGYSLFVKSDAESGMNITVIASYSDQVTKSFELNVTGLEVEWPTATFKENPTYGDTWAEIVTGLTGGSASLNGEKIPGTFTLNSTGGPTAAGEQEYSISFKSDDEEYWATGLQSVYINPCPVTLTWSGNTNLVYNGSPKNVTATVNGVINNDECTVIVTNGNQTEPGTYTATAVLEGWACSNYQLTDASCTYTIAKATVALPTAVTGLTYTGETQTGVVLPTGAKYTLTGNTATDAGSHTATAALTEPTHYQWANGSSEAQSISWSIAPADYQVSLSSAAVSVKLGTSDTDFLPNSTAVGVNSEPLNGTLKFYTDADRTEVTDEWVSKQSLGDHTLYWSFTANDSNYVSTAKTGSITMTVIAGDPQYISFADASKTVTYGDAAFTNVVTVKTTNDASVTDGGAITYQSSDNDVVTVNANGQVTIVGAGTATITATAAAVSGRYAQGTGSYTVTVNPKTLTETMVANVSNETYSGSPIQPEPAVTDGEALVKDVDFTYSYQNNTNAGTATVTVTGKGNYQGTVTKNFTINKADYEGTAAKTVSIVKNRTEAQTGTLTAADFLTETLYGATITGISGSSTNVLSTVPTVAGGVLSYTSKANLTGSIPNDEYSVTIETTNYNNIIATLIFHATDKTDVSDKITFEDGSAVYNGAEQTYEKATCTLTAGTIRYTYSATEVKNAGEYTVTATYEDNNNMGSKTATFTIEKKPLTVSVGTAAITKVYDGNTSAGALTGAVVVEGICGADAGKEPYVTLYNIPAYTDANVHTEMLEVSVARENEIVQNYRLTLESQKLLIPATITAKPITPTVENITPVTYDGEAQEPAVTVKDGETVLTTNDYTVKYENNVNAGTAKAIITAKAGGNYTFSQVTKNFTINKANFGTVPAKVVNIVRDRAEAQTGSLSAADLVANAPAGATVKAVSTGTGAIMAEVKVENGKVAYTSEINLDKTAAAASYTVTIESTNYNDFDVTLTFQPVDKEDAQLTLTAPKSKTYGDGAFQLSAAVANPGANGKYTWSVTNGSITGNGSKATASIANAGTMAVTVTYESDTTMATATANITIEKATVTVRALDRQVRVGMSVPTLGNILGKDYTVEGLGYNDKLGGTVTLSYAKTPNTSSTGRYEIVPAGGTVPNTGNYNDAIVYKNGTLSVVSNEKPQVTVTGGAHGFATISDPDAKEGDVVAITVTCDPGYEVDEVTVTTLSGKSVRVVKTGSKYTFVMPAEKVKIQVTYQEIQKVAYSDVVVGSWYEEAVAYVSDNGIMNGVGGGKFAPNRAVTRAMVWTVLARMDGEDTATTALWYAKAQQWAMETGVSDGTNPESAITREQLATMLYRYYGSPAVSGSLSGYADGASVTDWAKDAMVWAVQEGLIQGTGANKLSPTADTTRAQLAQILMRLDLKF